MIIESFDEIENDNILLLKIMKNMIIDTDTISNDPSSATPSQETPIATETLKGVGCSAWLDRRFLV